MSATECARFYRARSLVVLPVRRGTKECHVKDWHRRPPEELETMISDEDNIAIRLDGLTVIDIERPEIFAALFKGVNVEEIAKKRWVCKTGKGYHVYVRGETAPLRVDGLVEIRSGSSQYVVTPPSVHPNGAQYQWITNVDVVEISDMTPEMLKRMREKIELIRDYRLLILEFVAAWVPDHRHNISLGLAGALRKSGLPYEKARLLLETIARLANDEELQDRIRALDDTYKKPKTEIAAWSILRAELESYLGPERTERILRHFRPSSHENEASMDVQGDVLVEEVKRKPEYLVGGEVIGDALIEVVAGPKLFVYYPANNQLVTVSELILNGIIYKPYPDLPFLLPNALEKVEPDPTLWHETQEFIKTYFEHLDPRVYDVMTAAVAWSYFYRDVRASTPYLLFLGPWRSGKTRALEVLESLCYRAVRGVDPSEAALFRGIESFRPTLLVDEAQIVDQDVRAVMASGYRFGSKVWRVIDPESEGLDGIKFFNTYAFIIYASREEPPADILSRSIVIRCERNMRPTAKRINEEKAAKLRTRWLTQRLYHHGKITLTFEEFPSEDGRIQELFSPLVVMAQVFGNNEAAESVKSYGRETESELRQLEASTPEAEVVEALLKHVENAAGDAPSIVYVTDVQGLLGEDWTPHKIGRRLAALGFKRFKAPGGKRGYIVDHGLLRRLAVRYGLKSAILDDFRTL